MIKLNLHKKLAAATGEMNLALQADIPTGQFLSIYGASGAGKTSSLRMIAGLLQADRGTIIVDNQIWLDTTQKINWRPQARKIGYVFQDYALFPNMTVRQNLEFALQKKQKQQIVNDLIRLMELGDLQNRKPTTLSGGQQQRVALARALVQQPQLLLLDEPLSALDRTIRLKLQNYLLKVHRAFKLTTILISHDIAEIMKLSDHVWVLENGKIIKRGTPTEVFIQSAEHSSLSLVGTILKITEHNTNYELNILIQHKVIQLTLDYSTIKSLNIGDQVALFVDGFKHYIQKI